MALSTMYRVHLVVHTSGMLLLICTPPIVAHTVAAAGKVHLAPMHTSLADLIQTLG